MSKVKESLKVMTLVKLNPSWQVTLFNCNCHTFDDVIDLLMGAISCSSNTASHMAHVVLLYLKVKRKDASK